MDNQIVLSELKKKLKAFGFKKNKNYWYKEHKGYLLCLNFQNSQWCTDDYYIEFGIAYIDSNITCPNLLQWFCRHRCIGKDGELNVPVDDIILFLEIVHNEYPAIDQIEKYIIDQGGVRVINQYWY